MRKFCCFVCLMFMLFSAVFLISKRTESVNKIFNSSCDIIIDAGHGYPDGGAVAADGTIESQLNLQISLLLEQKLSDLGYNCLLTRSDENGIYSEGNSIHAKKVSDIRNRVSLANKNKNAFLISIHMNTYPSQNVRGIQVFYKSNTGFAKNVAEECQNAINLILQKDNPKVLKRVPPSIYLFKNIDNESILIECGFITNEQDLSLLKDENYRLKLVNTIAESISYKLKRK